jgi:sigma-B regulation protein RsbU (phosphoserine phosphatase)
VLGRVVQTRRSVLVEDVAADPDFVSAHADVVAKISSPILGDRDVLGVLNVESCCPQGLGAGDVRLLELLAQMMAVSLGNARLHAAAQRRAQELLIVQRISAQVAALRDPAELAELVAHELRQELGYPLVAIYFLDEGGRAQPAASAGYMPEAIARFDPTLGVIGRVLRTTTAALVLDPAGDTDFLRTVPGVCGQVCVPIRVGDQVLGALNAETTVSGQFGPGDLELLELLARQVAVSVQNARLYQGVMPRYRQF